MSESPKKKAPGSLPKKSPKSTPAPKKEDLKPTPQDAPLPSTTGKTPPQARLMLFLAKSAWPNTGKTLAEVFKTQPAATIPIEKPNVQTSATPPKPASIASDKDAPAKPAARAPPARKPNQNRQKAA